MVSDSVDAAHVGAYGYSRDTTPFLDELAASGAVLERAVSQTSWTLSSVASLLTGLEQEAHGVTQIEQSLPLDGPTTLGELFRRRGYRTVGLVQNAVLEEGTGLDRGFDRFDYVRFTDEGSDDLVLIPVTFASQLMNFRSLKASILIRAKEGSSRDAGKGRGFEEGDKIEAKYKQLCRRCMAQDPLVCYSHNFARLAAEGYFRQLGRCDCTRDPGSEDER